MVTATAERVEIRPQAGRQEQFLSSPADITIYGGSAGGGKALALDTKLATIDGWTTMRNVQVGDYVFGKDGSPVKVVYKSPIMHNHDCYRVEFSDGAVLVADAEHLWVTMDEKERDAAFRRTDDYRQRKRMMRKSRSKGKRPDVAKLNRERNYYALQPPSGTARTTVEIMRTLLVRRGRRNHSIDVARHLQLPPSTLPIEPYLLGVWLGDGIGREGRIAIFESKIVDELRKAGSRLWHIPSNANDYRVEGLQTALREAGLLNNKHIPGTYLRASFEQRLALLQGLMDSDGYAGANGKCEFTGTCERLVKGVHELILTLGIKANISTGRAMLNGIDCGEKYRIGYVTAHPVFRLRRKLKRQRNASIRATTKRRYIVAIEKVESVPVQCIQVDADDHLFLAGRELIPTHNTWALLIEPLRHKDNGEFGAVIFRRTYKEITEEGALWDESEKIYSLFWARQVKGDLYWQFNSGAKVSFAHLQYEKNLRDYQGAQIALICFDQLEHFTEKMFFYMMSRNRSTCGIKPYIRGTCNPEPGWLAEFLDWWIADDGYADLDRVGKIRWFVRVNEELIWADSKEELVERYPDLFPKSVTFIVSTVYDNKILLEKDPGYLANLMLLPLVERERLLGDRKRGGNWKIKPSAGKVFNRAWFSIVEAVPAGGIVVRRWDFAATEKEMTKDDPDYSASCVMLKSPDGGFYILDATNEQIGPAEVDRQYKNLARQDAARYRGQGRRYLCRWEQEPGSSGKRESWRMVKELAGIDAKGIPSTGDKLTRARPLAAQAEVGNVYLLKGPWNERWLNHMHGQPDWPHDDEMDAASGGLHDLTMYVVPAARSWQG